MLLARFWLFTLLVAGCRPIPQKTAAAGDEAAQRAAADTRKALASGQTGLIYARSQTEDVQEAMLGPEEKSLSQTPLVLVVRSDGNVLHNGVLIASADFAKNFAGHVQATLQVEESLEYAKLVSLVDQLREAGVSDVIIAPANPLLP